jgi:hypothetical protein
MDCKSVPLFTTLKATGLPDAAGDIASDADDGCTNVHAVQIPENNFRCSGGSLPAEPFGGF